MTMKILPALLAIGSCCAAAHLSRAADKAFSEYAGTVEARLAERHSIREVAPDSIRVEAVKPPAQLPGALLHHWRAAAFVPGASAEQMLALLRDYNMLPRYYAPQIASARVLADDGKSAVLSVRMKEQKVWTIVLDAEYSVESGLVGNDRGYSASRSTSVWQIDNPGSGSERRRTPGDDDGYLWRLNSYWSFTRARGGLAIECEAISLTRDVPLGLGWLIAPVIQNLPSETLQFTIRSTKNALLEIASKKGTR